MSNTDVAPDATKIELPSVPGSKTFITQTAAMIAVLVPVLAHKMGFVNFPAIDESMIVPWLTTVFALGLMLHRYGLNTVAQYIIIHMTPIVQQIVQQSLDQAVAKIQSTSDQAAAPAALMSSEEPEEDLSRFLPVLDAVGVRSTQVPSAMAFTINGKPYEPVDLLKAVETLRSAAK